MFEFAFSFFCFNVWINDTVKIILPMGGGVKNVGNGRAMG
jgi:hypothetical protein